MKEYGDVVIRLSYTYVKHSQLAKIFLRRFLTTAITT